MVRQLTPLTLAASLILAASVDAQDPSRARTTIRTSPYGAVVALAGDADRLVLGLSTSSGGMRDTLGLLISAITPESPAEKAGLEEGNRITAINSMSLKLNAADAGDPDMAGVLGRRFQRELDKMKAGEAVTLRVYANGQNKEVKLTPVRADELRPMRGAARARMDERPTIGASLGGFASPRDTLGVFVVAVAEDGPLAKAGIFEGSRIASINGVDLRVPAADVGDDFMTSSRVRRLTREVEKLAPGANAELRVYSGGQTRTVTVKAVKRSELKQDVGISIFHSGGGTGVFMPPMFDMPTFRFDMNHDMGDDVRQRIEEALRGNQIQLRTLQERMRDSGTDLRDLGDQLRDNGSILELQQLLRTLPERIRISGDSGGDAIDRLGLEQSYFREFEQAAPAFRSAMATGSDLVPAGQYTASFDAQPFFNEAVQPRTGGGFGYKGQGVQASQSRGGQGAQPRQGRSTGSASYSRSGDQSTQGAVFMVGGIRLSPVNAQLASYLGAGSERGLLVLEIDDTWSGMIAGDVLLSIDGRAVVRDRDNIQVAIDDSKELPIQILRGGETIKGTLKRR
jgi:S1-C subfamily serine protease